jgi:hypothetical protein
VLRDGMVVEDTLPYAEAAAGEVVEAAEQASNG